MEKINRRGILCAAASALPGIAQSDAPGIRTTDTTGAVVVRGQDRFGKPRSVGVSVMTFKVTSQETKGALFVIENVIAKKGGPPRHLHHNEDEHFYVIEGDFVIEVGGKRFRLHAGDSILAPRKVPHAYAFVGDVPGRLLISYAPANKMQEYFETRGEGENYSSDADRFRAYGMELVGPPIEL